MFQMKEWKTVILLSAAGLVFRVLHYLVLANEIVPSNDRVREIILGRRFASGDFYGVLDTYWAPLYPILIGIFAYPIKSIVLPAVIISIIAGTLVVPLTYYLVKQSYGRSEAVIAAVIAVFFPHLMNSVFALGSENIYLLWILGALVVCWKGLENNSVIRIFLVGILLGLAYLTRPEAIGYPIFFALVVFVKNLWRRELFARHSLLQIAALLLGFAILASPYIFYLRSETGSWTISGKTKVNTVASEYLYTSSEENNDSEGAAPISQSQPSKVQAGKDIVKKTAINLFNIHNDFPYLLPLFLLSLVTLGLFGERWGKERLKRETYLFLFCFLTILGYAAAVVQTRYFYILLPVFFGWIACGILRLEGWFHESFQNWFPNKPSYPYRPVFFIIPCIILIYFYTLPLNFFMRSEDKAWRSKAYEEREAGLWLKENGKASSTIFSASLRTVLYAEGNAISPETTDANAILEQLKDCSIDYIALSERSLKRSPYLADVNKAVRNDPEFQLVYQNVRKPGYEIWIFKLKSCDTSGLQY